MKLNKYILSMVVLFVLMLGVQALGFAAEAYTVGQKIQVEWKGSWYLSTIKEVKDGKYKIHYDGWSDSWDEWVGTNRMKASGASDDFSVGNKVQVKWKGAWYPSTIKEVKDGKYKIHYDGWSDSWDEWVGTSRIRK
ncbi:MAG: hypothetical protein ACD_62C00415G0001 [uncultured bacterium]|nr:MAG: hypothetical protein ACD_62C00415G0001 [uncultured bacterium]HLD46003.1 Tudor-knot domain-containing protein [bacterium]